MSSTLLVLASSLQSIDARLRSLESAGASTSAAAGMFPPVGAPPPAPAPLVAVDEPQSTLASAVAAPFSGRPYVPASADFSPRLRSHILQGRNINLIRLILPSPECDVSITASSQICAIIKTANPRQARDMSIGEFVVAFGIFREVLCSVFPQRRKELDGYLALIGDLICVMGRMFFTYTTRGSPARPPSMSPDAICCWTGPCHAGRGLAGRGVQLVRRHGACTCSMPVGAVSGMGSLVPASCFSQGQLDTRGYPWPQGSCCWHQRNM